MVALRQDEPVYRLSRDADARRRMFGDAVLSHPAKQNISQLVHLLATYGTRGGLLLDPFGGSGTSMLATAPANGGMYVVTVELAPHFLKLQRDAWAHFQTTMEMQDPEHGDYLSLYGDSRELPTVLTQAAIEQGCTWDGADLIVTSPSYGGSEAVDQRKTQNTTIAAHGGGNVAKLRYDVPEMAKNGDGIPLIPRLGAELRTTFGKHSQLDARQYGYSPSVDLVVTSPPYADSLHGGVGAALQHARRIEASGGSSFYRNVGPASQIAIDNRYDTSSENIGNERGNKYLASMARVWAGCAWALKPGGILCCITRDCVRDGKIVPVGRQNCELLEAAGLRLLTCETWKVGQMSFWRTLQHRKNPNAPIIDTEQVFVFQKPEVA